MSLKSKGTSLVILAVFLLVSATFQKTLVASTSNLICPKGTLTASTGTFTPALEYDATSLYYDGDTDDSARLFVKFGSSTGPTNFKFFRYDEDLTDRT